MTSLPVVSGHSCVKALEKAGFVRVRQKGSHILLCREEPSAQVVAPDHRERDRGTLRGILRCAGVGVEEFAGLL